MTERRLRRVGVVTALASLLGGGCALSTCGDATAADAGQSDDAGQTPQPVVCDAGVRAMWTAGSVGTFPRSRTLDAVDQSVAGQVTLVFDDGYQLGFAIDPDAPPLLPSPGPVSFLNYAGDCWGEGCDPIFLALEATEVGVFAELGSLNILDGEGRPPVSFGSGLLGIRAGTSADVCPDDGRPLFGVLQVNGEDSVVELLPGQVTVVAVGGDQWHVAAETSEGWEFIATDTNCDDCASPGRHTEAWAGGVAYRIDAG